MMYSIRSAMSLLAQASSPEAPRVGRVLQSGDQEPVSDDEGERVHDPVPMNGQRPKVEGHRIEPRKRQRQREHAAHYAPGRSAARFTKTVEVWPARARTAGA